MLPLKLTALRRNESLIASLCVWYLYSQCWATHKAWKTKQVREGDREREGSVCVCGGGADVSHIHIQTSRKLDPPPTIRSRDHEGLLGLLLGCINRLCHTNNDRPCQASINIFTRPLQNQQWSYRQRPKQECSNREVILRIYDCLLKTLMLVLVEGVDHCLHKNDQFQSELCAVQNLKG